MTLPLVLLNRRRIGGFNPRAIIAGSTAMVWLDPSDLTTLFQDAAGTTPVTAPAQPVGLVLDKSQGLVLGPERVTNGDFSAGSTGWTVPAGWSITGGAAVATATSDSLRGGGVNPVLGRGYRVEFDVISYTSGTLYITVGGNFTGRVGLTGSGMSPGRKSIFVLSGSDAARGVEFYGGSVTITIDNISVRELPGFHATQSTAANRPTYGVVPSRGRVNILNATATLATQTRPVTAAQHTLSFRGTGTITLSGASTAGPLVGTGANDIVSLTFTPTAGNLTLTVSGTVNDAQLELGAARGTYQLVSDAAGFNITDPVGFPSYPLHYLFFGGDLDPRWLQTSTITPNADKVQVFAGVRKLSDAAAGMIVESSTDAGSNNGAFRLLVPGSAGYEYRQRGSINAAGAAASSGYASPITNVLTGIGDIAADNTTLRVNGTQVAQSTADQGTGNFLAYPLFIGRRNGASLAFNGQLYGLIVRFSTANLDASVIAQTERWLAQKTGVTL